jgi:DNA-binding transcriptional LysR family regulator
MNDINLNLYKIFYVLAYSKSFSQAAEKLYISQPAVSNHIKNLESALGVKLFLRLNRELKITEEGKELLKYVERSYNFLVAGQKNITEINSLNKGTLTIGSPSHIASLYILELIKKFRIDYPGIKFKIISDSTQELISDLSKSKVDMVIDFSPIEVTNEDMTIKMLTTFEHCFISKKAIEHEFSDLENLSNYQFILPASKGSVRKNLNSFLQSQNISIDCCLEVETTDLIISSVKKGLGVGYVIKESVLEDFNQETLYEIKINQQLPLIELNLIYMKDFLSPSAKAFIRKIENSTYN